MENAKKLLLENYYKTVMMENQKKEELFAIKHSAT